MKQTSLVERIEKYHQKWYFRMKQDTKRRIHALLLPVIRLRMRLDGWKIQLSGEENLAGLKQTLIIASNHVGKADIEIVAAATGLHSYLLTNDFDAIKKRVLDAFFLALTGVLYFDPFNRMDSARIKGKIIDTLRSGGNIMWFPEGEWNLSPNVLVLPLFWGMAEAVHLTDALVLPVGMQIINKTYHVKIGKPFDLKQHLMQDEPLSQQSKQQAMDHLREVLATLVWEILEIQPVHQRKAIHPQSHQQYIEKRLSEWPGSSQQAIESRHLNNRVR